MTTRDAIKLAQRVERWRDRLVHLGLGHWRIDRVSIVDQTPSGPYAKASVTPSHAYDSCVFWFTNEFLDDATERELDETIIHEWMHVVMRDLDQAIESIENTLSDGRRDSWSDRVNHEREGLIDRMARQIYVLYTSDAEPTPAQLRRASR